MSRRGPQSANQPVEEQMREKDELFIQILNHLRHDWMNDIQVLYGYLRLNKYEKMLEYVETIKQKAARESLVSELGVPDLIVYLQAFRVQCRSIRLDLNLEQGFTLTGLPVDAERVAALIIDVLERFKRFSCAAQDGEPNRMNVELSVEGERLHLRFDFQGDYDLHGLEAALCEMQASFRSPMPVEKESQFGPRRASVTIYVPLTAQ